VKSRDGWGNLASRATSRSRPRSSGLISRFSGSVAPEPAAIGDTLTYQYALTNNGPARASNVTLQVTLAAGLSAGAATVSQGSCSTQGQTVSCALGALDAGITAGLLSIGPVGSGVGRSRLEQRGRRLQRQRLSGVYDQGVLRGQPGAISGDTAAAFSGSVTVTVPNARAGHPQRRLGGGLGPSDTTQKRGISEDRGRLANSQYMLFLEGGVAKFRLRNAAGALLTSMVRRSR